MKQSREFALGSMINLVTLAIGLLIGFLTGAFFATRTAVHAQVMTPTGPQIEDVAPNMTVGSIGTNLLMAHEVDADQITINGYDLMKIEQGIINYLATRPGAEAADFQNLVNASRSSNLHRLKLSTPAMPPKVEKKP